MQSASDPHFDHGILNSTQTGYEEIVSFELMMVGQGEDDVPCRCATPVVHHFGKQIQTICPQGKVGRTETAITQNLVVQMKYCFL